MRFATLAAVVLAATPAIADDKDDVKKAATRAAEMESYSFKAEMALDGGLGNLGNQAPTPSIEGKHQKDVGTHITIGEYAEIVRKGDRVAVKSKGGEWQDPEAMAGGAGKGRARGLVKSVKTPHEELKDFESVFKEIKKADRRETIDGKECAVYSGDLSEDGAKKLNPMSAMLDRFRNMGFDMGGSAKLWIDGDGVIRKYEITTTLSGQFQAQAFDLSLVRTVELTKIGETKVELPAAAVKILEKKD